MADITRQYMPNALVAGAKRDLDFAQESATTDVLASLALGTGGEFFRNNNDLKTGFGELAGHQGYYVLGFSPTDFKQDGKYHALKITMAEEHRGYSILARRGYFAATNQPEVAGMVQPASSEPEAPAQEQIREALNSKDEIAQLPVVLEVKPPAGQGDTRELPLAFHMDASVLHFRKDAGRNYNDVSFVVAIFDLKDKQVQVQGRAKTIGVRDDQLPTLFRDGLDLNMSFELKPGAYRVRAVVTDSEDHRMATLSRNVVVQ
jgi:hypothetical protein